MRQRQRGGSGRLAAQGAAEVQGQFEMRAVYTTGISANSEGTDDVYTVGECRLASSGMPTTWITSLSSTGIEACLDRRSMRCYSAQTLTADPPATGDGG